MEQKQVLIGKLTFKFPHPFLAICETGKGACVFVSSYKTTEISKQVWVNSVYAFNFHNTSKRKSTVNAATVVYLYFYLMESVVA